MPINDEIVELNKREAIPLHALVKSILNETLQKEHLVENVDRYLQPIYEFIKRPSKHYQTKWNTNQAYALDNYASGLKYVLSYFQRCNLFDEGKNRIEKFIYFIEKILKHGHFKSKSVEKHFDSLQKMKCDLYGNLLCIGSETNNYLLIETYIQKYYDARFSKKFKEKHQTDDPILYKTLYNVSLAIIAYHAGDLLSVETYFEKIFSLQVAKYSTIHGYFNFSAKIASYLKDHYQNSDPIKALNFFILESRYLSLTGEITIDLPKETKEIYLKQSENLIKLAPEYKARAYASLQQKICFLVNEFLITSISDKRSHNDYLIISFKTAELLKEFVQQTQKDNIVLKTPKDNKNNDLYVSLKNYEAFKKFEEIIIEFFNKKQDKKTPLNIPEKELELVKLDPLSTQKPIEHLISYEPHEKIKTRSSPTFFSSSNNSLIIDNTLVWPDVHISYPPKEKNMHVIKLNKTLGGLQRYAYIPNEVFEQLEPTLQKAALDILEREKYVSRGVGLKYLAREERPQGSNQYILKIHPKGAQGKGDIRLYGFTAEDVLDKKTGLRHQLVIFDYIADHRLLQLPTAKPEKYYSK